jgi:S-DNA-T family DNA segregation ATPase FtsK/SpoIIIE
MARNRKSKKPKMGTAHAGSTFDLHPEARQGVLVIFFIGVAILMLLALLDTAGALGRGIRKILEALFGAGASLSPLLAGLLALAFLLQALGIEKRDEGLTRFSPSPWRVFLGGLFLVLSFFGVLHLAGARGGLIGKMLGVPLQAVASSTGAAVVLIVIFIASIVVTFNVSLRSLSRFFSRLKRKSDRAETPSYPSFVRSDIEAAPEEVFRVEEERATKVPEEVRKQEIKFPGQSEPATAAKTPWQLPPLSLLDKNGSAADAGNIEAARETIRRTLANFGIEVEMGPAQIGPTVTQYTLRPAEGVKLSQITTLAPDLALALAAPAIRIEAPIPGKSLVGIEAPNRIKATVRLREVLENEAFREHLSPLAFGLGKDVAGKPKVADLERMPHLLIAGATGAGKSVMINALLLSLLFRNPPHAVRLLVIDPKRVELGLYNGIAHLLTPIVIDHMQAVRALQWSVAEMDRRYTMLSAVGKRNIQEYNQSSLVPMPYLLVIIDELADLMSVAANEVEQSIVRLAQMARAVGIHLVLATQRPSVDVITGLIKANITCRIAFACASQADSRTILDAAGAEKLLGSGDMLYMTPELTKPKRLQGAYVTENEVSKVIEFIRKQGSPIYQEGVLEHTGTASRPSGGSDFDDPLLPEAERTVTAAGKASASLLQRRLRIGYARAARLLDLLEEKGIIGPQDGAKPREVYGTTAPTDGEDDIL